jgi:hypothetical protein
MALDDIVDLVVTAATAAPTREGFGVPLIASYHVHGLPTLVSTYKKPADLISAGFSVSEGAYLKAAVMCSQRNKPKNFKLGRLQSIPTQTVTLKCMSAVEGDVYTIDVTPPGGTSTTISYTVVSSETTTTVATAIEALIEALSEITSSPTTDTITVTTTAGKTAVYANWSDNFHFTDTTADAGIANDLADILEVDSGWYVLLVDGCSEAVINAAAAWAQANGKLYIASTSDWGVQDSGTTTDVASDLKSNAYDHVAIYWNGRKCPSQLDAAIAGDRLPYRPGEDTWEFKQLSGVPAFEIQAGPRNTLVTKRVNFLDSVQGLNITQGGGKTTSGEYLDVIRGLDWLKSEIKIRLLTALVNAKKIGYTDAGVDLIKGVIMGALQAGVRVTLLAKSPAPTVTAPKVADISEADRLDRHLPDIEFSAVLEGAVHTVSISGLVSV